MKKDDNILLIAATVLQAYIERIAEIAHLAVLEAQLAKRTAVLIMSLVFLLTSFITVGLLVLQAVLFFFLVSRHYDYLTASSVLLVLNIGIVGSVIAFIYHIKTNLYFPNTRAQFGKDIPHDSVESEN